MNTYEFISGNPWMSLAILICIARVVHVICHYTANAFAYAFAKRNEDTK
mgnify:CR=1 FL=1